MLLKWHLFFLMKKQRLEGTHIAAHPWSLLVPAPAAQTTSKAGKKKQNRLNQRREKNQNSRSETEAGDGIEIRPAPSADRFRSSSPLTAADRGRRNRSEQARSPSRTGGTVDPRGGWIRASSSPRGGIGRGPRRRTGERGSRGGVLKRGRRRVPFRVSDGLVGDVFPFYLFRENGPNANPNVYFMRFLIAQKKKEDKLLNIWCIWFCSFWFYVRWRCVQRGLKMLG